MEEGLDRPWLTLKIEEGAGSLWKLEKARRWALSECFQKEHSSASTLGLAHGTHLQT